MSSRARAATAPRLQQPALVLRRFPYGESSLVLHVLTPGAGRVALLAKGAYRPSSGYFAVFDLFDTLSVLWTAGRGQELGLVTRAAVRRRRPRVAADLGRYRTGLALLELAQLTGREGHDESALFAWLEGGLELLEAERTAPGLVEVAWDLQLLRANGLSPALGACASCAAAPAERAGSVPVSTALGGRLCARCAAAERQRGRAVESLPLNVLRVAESLRNATPAMLEHTHLGPGLLERVRAFVARFLEYHLETRPRSRRSSATAAR